MAKYPEFFVDVMMRDELGLEPPAELMEHVKSGFVCFTSFLICGSVPLIGFVMCTPVLSKTTYVRTPNGPQPEFPILVPSVTPAQPGPSPDTNSYWIPAFCTEICLHLILELLPQQSPHVSTHTPIHTNTNPGTQLDSHLH